MPGGGDQWWARSALATIADFSVECIAGAGRRLRDEPSQSNGQKQAIVSSPSPDANGEWQCAQCDKTESILPYRSRYSCALATAPTIATATHVHNYEHFSQIHAQSPKPESHASPATIELASKSCDTVAIHLAASPPLTPEPSDTVAIHLASSPPLTPEPSDTSPSTSQSARHLACARACQHSHHSGGVVPKPPHRQ